MPTQDKDPNGRRNQSREEEEDYYTGNEYVSADELRRQADQIESGEIPPPDGKDPVRVAAGLRAAATRKDRYEFPRPGDKHPISQGGTRDTSKEDLTRKHRK